MEKYILLISAVFPPEPVVSGRLTMDLYSALKAKGEKVKVMHPKPTRPFGFTPDINAIGRLGEDEVTAESYVCPQSTVIGRFRESWSFGKACELYIRNHKDEIACVYANSWPLFSQFFIVQTAKKYGIPSVIHVQDIYPESLTNKLTGVMGKLINMFFLPMDKYILRNCCHVVAISEKMKYYLVSSRDINLDKISVVINWQDESKFLEYFEEEELHKFTFMYMGNIGPVAGVDLLIDAFIKANLKNARLVIAGSGSMKESLRNSAKDYSEIVFWDVPNGKVPEIQSKADVMMLPIKKGAASSSIPSKLPAYMFSAKPIIGCMDEGCDTADAIHSADCGWVIEPENVELLVSTMKEVVSMSVDMLKKKGNNARNYGLEHFSKEVNLNKLTKVIQDII